LEFPYRWFSGGLASIPSAIMPSAMLEHDAQMLGLRDSTFPRGTIGSPQHTQIRGFIRVLLLSPRTALTESDTSTAQGCVNPKRENFTLLALAGAAVHKKFMKSLTEHLWFEVPQRRGFLNITRAVEDLVRRSGVQEGLCLVNAMHITASVFINDDEGGLHHDYDVWLEKLAPHAPTSQYEHNRTGEDNADAHMKRQIMGREVVVAITRGKLDFGPWEQIFYGEFDGRRRKRALVKIIGE
jgi:secondary thiamine-phosphate synthase enzyme